MTGRGLAARRQATRILFVAIALDAFVIALFVTAPNTMGPLVSSPPPDIWLVPGVGIAMNVAGLAFMIRVLWTIRDAERRPSSWRSRS